MFNTNLQNVLKQAMAKNLEFRPEMVAAQRLTEVELAKETPDMKELIRCSAELTARIMKHSIDMESALANSGSLPEELLMVPNVVNGSVNRSEYVDHELVAIFEENEQFGSELSQPMVEMYGDRARTILMEKLEEQGLIGEFTDAITKAVESAAPSESDKESLARVWTKENVAKACPKLADDFNKGWDLAASQDATKH
jgi:ribosomal protein S24E